MVYDYFLYSTSSRRTGSNRRMSVLPALAPALELNRENNERARKVHFGGGQDEGTGGDMLLKPPEMEITVDIFEVRQNRSQWENMLHPSRYIIPIPWDTYR